MKFMCIKTVFFENNVTDQTFTKGKIYEKIEDSHVNDDFCVIDDQKDKHYIESPGDDFFDKHFEIIDDREENGQKSR